MPDFSPRRLIDLEPSWIMVGGRICGIAFRCPIHEVVPDNPEFVCWNRIGFTNPPDGGPKPSVWRLTWERKGTTFETLVISPSIRNLGFHDGGGCRWHGYVGAPRGDKPGMVITLKDSR
jgi:hypothetical protein